MKHIREEKGKLGFHRFFKSFIYSFEGLKYAFRYEQNMLFHLCAAILVILVSVFLNLKVEEWLLVFVSIALVMASELFNTAIEATIDLATSEIHPLAKIAKDTASAAVFVFAMTALLIGLFIFIPKLILLF